MSMAKQQSNDAAADAPAVSPTEIAVGDSESVEGGKVHVPQADGEIVFTQGGVVRKFRVSDHMVSPKTDDERAKLLRLVRGSKLA